MSPMIYVYHEHHRQKKLELIMYGILYNKMSRLPKGKAYSLKTERKKKAILVN